MFIVIYGIISISSMDTINVPVQVLAIVLISLVALFTIVRAFRLPKKYYIKERERQALRRRLIELEYEKTHKKAVPEDAAEKKNNPQPLK
jgi:hypothetical protein